MKIQAKIVHQIYSHYRPKRVILITVTVFSSVRYGLNVL